MPIGTNESLMPLKSYRKLATTNGRIELGAFLVEGKRSVNQMLESFPERIKELLVLEGNKPVAGSFPTRFLTSRQLQLISQMETPQDIIAVVKLPEDIYADALPENAGLKILFLEDIQDPGNVGTLIRTAAAFDFDGIILSQRSADPFSPKCVQATAGSILSIWIRRTGAHFEMVRRLQDSGFKIMAAATKGNAEPAELGSCKKLVLALGSEARGLSYSLLETADIRVRIPIDIEKAESLNVAVSGAILMYLSRA